MKEKSKRRAASSRSSELSSPTEPVGGGGGPGPKISLGGVPFFGDTIAGVDLVWGGGGGAPHTNQDTTLYLTSTLSVILTSIYKNLMQI